jgi:hypothetical protein
MNRPEVLGRNVELVALGTLERAEQNNDLDWRPVKALTSPQRSFLTHIDLQQRVIRTRVYTVLSMVEPCRRSRSRTPESGCAAALARLMPCWPIAKYFGTM